MKVAAIRICSRGLNKGILNFAILIILDFFRFVRLINLSVHCHDLFNMAVQLNYV